jgi:hypothetical protein
VNAEFNWWLLIVGLVAGAGLAWLVLADLGGPTVTDDEAERADEADWIVSRLEREGLPADPELVERVLELRDRPWRPAITPLTRGSPFDDQPLEPAPTEQAPDVARVCRALEVEGVRPAEADPGNNTS